MKEWILPIALVLSLAALPSPAREVNNLESITRELKIAKDLFRSAMKNSLPERARVSNVSAQFLVRQGVLVSMDVVVPWFNVDAFANRSAQLGRDVESVQDIPELVHEILAELNIALGPYSPEEMAEIRALQAEQREIRRTQGELRATLRSLRRDRDRIDDRESLDTEIREIETEIQALGGDHDKLDEEIELEHERLSTLSKAPDRALPTADIDAAVADTVCHYGATFKTLGSQQYLTVAVSTAETIRYYVFRMEHIHDCRKNETTAARLLERSYHYVL